MVGSRWRLCYRWDSSFLGSAGERTLRVAYLNLARITSCDERKNTSEHDNDLSQGPLRSQLIAFLLVERRSEVIK